jgi:hypothetical protein
MKEEGSDMKIKKYIIVIISAIILIIGMKYIKDRYDIKNTIAINEQLHKAIQNYLDNEFRRPVAGGKVLSSYIIYGAKKNEIYVSVVIKEYLTPRDTTHGLLTELVLLAEEVDSGVVITDYKMPPDGTDYGKTLKKWFTKEAFENWLHENKGDNTKKMERELDERAVQWFKNH